MEYSFDQLGNIAKSLRERYPIGTRIKLLSMGEDPRPIPPGTKGTVEGIDDIATVFCKFDNGRSLGLAYGEDHYRALTQRELLEEKCARNYDKYFDAVHRDIFADVDLDRFAEEIENANDNYTIDILKQLHDNLDDRQIYFVNQIINYIVKNGMLSDFKVLQEAPFTDKGDVADVFTDTVVWLDIMRVIKAINANAFANAA